MPSRTSGGKGRLRRLVGRVLWGDWPERDEEFDQAVNQALTREQQRERRLEGLEERVNLIRRSWR